MRLATLSSNPVLHFMCGQYSCVGDPAKGARFSAGSTLLILILVRTESTKPSKHKPALFLQASPTRDLARGHAPGGGPRPLARAPTRFTSVEQASEEGVEEGVQAWALVFLSRGAE